MSEKNIKLEQRLQKMKNFYLKAEQKIDDCPIPQEWKEKLKSLILDDKELNQLIDAVDNQRPPKLFLIGRTGAGKSSLINALVGSYVASVGDTRSCTEAAEFYPIKEGDRVLMEICDTRGIAESEKLNPNKTAEESLMEQINEFSPDVAIFVLGYSHRDDVDKDVEFLRKLSQSYKEKNKVPLPIVVVINRCDEALPGHVKEASQYSLQKKQMIWKAETHYKEIFRKGQLEINGIISVASLIYWGKEDGTILDSEEINNLPSSEREKLLIVNDFRYQIEELRDLLERAIPDIKAQMGLRMAIRTEEVVRRFASGLVRIFSALSYLIGLSPLPLSDIVPLLAIQIFLIGIIAALSGRDITEETAKEFLCSIVGTGGTGVGLRYLARLIGPELAKLVPGGAVIVSSAVASLGTKAIGAAAVAYFIDGERMEVAKEKFEQVLKKNSQKESVIPNA